MCTLNSATFIAIRSLKTVSHRSHLEELSGQGQGAERLATCDHVTIASAARARDLPVEQFSRNNTRSHASALSTVLSFSLPSLRGESAGRRRGDRLYAQIAYFIKSQAVWRNLREPSNVHTPPRGHERWHSDHVRRHASQAHSAPHRSSMPWFATVAVLM